MTFSDAPVGKPERVDVESDVDTATLTHEEVLAEQPEAPKGGQLFV